MNILYLPTGGALIHASETNILDDRARIVGHLLEKKGHLKAVLGLDLLTLVMRRGKFPDLLHHNT